MILKPDSLILGYADQLIAEHKAALPPGVVSYESLEDKLAITLETILGYLRKEDLIP